MPGAYARTATQALNNATHRWTYKLANQGLSDACRDRPEFISGINCMGGELTSPAVGEALHLPVADPVAMLGLE